MGRNLLIENCSNGYFIKISYLSVMRSLLILSLLSFLHLPVFSQESPTYVGGHFNDVTSVAYSPDGNYIVTGTYEGSIYLYYNDSTPTYYISFGDLSSTVHSLTFSRDSRYLLAGCVDGKVARYHFPHPDSMDYIGLDTIYEFSRKPINKVVYGPGLRTVYACDDGGMVHSFDLKKKVVRSFKTEGPAKSMAVSIDRKFIYVSSKGSTDIVQYNSLGKEIRRLSGHNGEVTDLEVTLDRKFLISCSRDKTVKIWNLATGKIEISLSNHNWDITAIAIDPYSKYVASCGLDGLINIYEISNGHLFKSFKNTNGRCTDVAFSSDASEVIVGLHMDVIGDDGYVANIWKTSIERPVKKPTPSRTTSSRSTSNPSKNTPQKPQKSSSSQTVIHKSDQVEISIEKE